MVPTCSSQVTKRFLFEAHHADSILAHSQTHTHTAFLSPESFDIQTGGARDQTTDLFMGGLLEDILNGF